jgi:GNAT superfamily N-acetyltransferase
VLYEGEVLGEGHTVPCCWDGTTDGLGKGIDAMVIAAFEAHEAGRRPTALCALAAEIRPRFQGRGLARQVIDAMAEVARTASLAHLIAPVRPTFKDRYPITPIERYVTWTNDAGEAFDPWIRVHLRRGGKILKPVPHSLRITATVAEWEQWTGMRFPGDGAYTFPAGLAPIEIDHATDTGTYWEPNVWIVHPVEN